MRDWTLHKHECSALQSWADWAPRGVSKGEGKETAMSVPSDAIRSLGRILWKSKKKGHENIWVSINTFSLEH